MESGGRPAEGEGDGGGVMLLLMPEKGAPVGATFSLDALSLASESIIDESADGNFLAAEAAPTVVLYPRKVEDV